MRAAWRAFRALGATWAAIEISAQPREQLFHVTGFFTRRSKQFGAACERTMQAA